MIIAHNNIIIDFNGQIISIESGTTSSPSGDIVQDGLFMKLDASSYAGSGQWLDQTANANNATINGATWLSTDGGIFDFDGTINTMTINHAPSLSLSSIVQKTIQMWVKIDTFPVSPNRMVLFGKLSSAFAFDGYWGGVSSTGIVSISTNGSAISKTSSSTLTISTNTWYLFTFISQITNTTNTTKVYVNDTEYVSAFHGTDGYTESNNLTFGYLTPPLTGLGQVSYLNGKVGASYFYTKGLSPSEISTNFNNTKSKYGY